MATRAALVVASYITVLYDEAKADLTDTFTEDYIATLTDITQDSAEVGWYWNGAEYVLPDTPLGELTDETFDEIVEAASTRSVASVNVTIQAETAARNLAIADLQDQIDTLGKTVPVNAQTGTSYTILNTDQGYLVTFSNASPVAVTLPQATGDFGSGYYFFALNKGAGTVTITPTTSTIGGAATLDLDQDSWALITSDGTNYQVLIGGGSGGGGVTSFEGRTGAVSLAAGDLDGALWTVTDVASGATTNIGAAATMMVRITGTTGISAFDTVAAGILRVGYFADAVTVTHNATSMILPSGANITTAANARFAALSLGSGNWLWLFYQPTNGKAIVAPSWSDITSKPTTISGFGITDAYAVGGTDVALADGGTGASLADPNADSGLFWDDSEGTVAFWTPGTGLAFSGTNLNLSLLGLQSLSDPNADRFFFWDDSAGAAAWLAPLGGLTISSTDLRVNECLAIPVTDETSTITSGTGKFTFRMPYAFTLTGVRASVKTAASSGTVTVDINESGTTILSTKLTIDSGEKTSTTAATAAVISDSALADDAEITIDIDDAATGAVGLKVYMLGYRP